MDFVGIGDLHLTDNNGIGGLASYLLDSDRYVISEVKRVLNWASDRGIRNVFLYGDICDSHRLSYRAMSYLISLFRNNPDFQFFVIPGNHDMEGETKIRKKVIDEQAKAQHSLELLMKVKFPNVRFLTEPEVVKIDKVPVKFCPWPCVDFHPKALNVAHIEVKGSKSDSGRVMDGDGLSKSSSVVCMGHLHTAHRVRNTYFSGTLYQTNFGESLPKYFHHGTFNTPQDYEINQIPFDPKYKLFNCVIESQGDVDALSRDPCHLLKVIVADGADVVIPDLPNIVVTKAYKTKSELTSILTEDLVQGQELIIKSDDFFKQWLSQREADPDVKTAAFRLRKQILSRL